MGILIKLVDELKAIMPLEYVKGQRGHNHLLYDGYRFVVDKTNDNITTWYCSEMRKCKCTSRVHTTQDNVVYYKDYHNHVPNAADIGAKKILNKLKEESVVCSETPLSLVASRTAGISSSVALSLPSIRGMKRMIQRKRQVTNFPLPLPNSLETLDLPEQYKKTLGGDNFLIFDSGHIGQRILIFGTPRNLELMETSPNWFADGTFKIAPNLFEQVKFDLFVIKVIEFIKLRPFLI